MRGKGSVTCGRLHPDVKAQSERERERRQLYRDKRKRIKGDRELGDIQFTGSHFLFAFIHTRKSLAALAPLLLGR